LSAQRAKSYYETENLPSHHIGIVLDAQEIFLCLSKNITRHIFFLLLLLRLVHCAAIKKRYTSRVFLAAVHLSERLFYLRSPAKDSTSFIGPRCTSAEEEIHSSHLLTLMFCLKSSHLYITGGGRVKAWPVIHPLWMCIGKVSAATREILPALTHTHTALTHCWSGIGKFIFTALATIHWKNYWA